jgi:DNA-binding MarR family transcriptional regulator
MWPGVAGMSVQSMTWAINQRVGNATGKHVLMTVAYFADQNGVCTESQRLLSDRSEMALRSVARWLPRLEEMGFLTRRHQQRGDGSRTHDLITLKMTLGGALS